MTKFRRRALISSVAMLLVALVALGSATFAWYEAQMTVQADGMTFTTNAASGLEIISASDAGSTTGQATQAQLNTANYGSDTDFAADSDNLQPASADTAGAFRRTTAIDSTHGGIAENAAISDSTDYLEEYVYFKTTTGGTNNTGKVQLTGITIDGDVVNSIDMTSAIRVVVFDASNTRVAEYAITGDATADYLKANGTYTAATASTYVGSDKVVLAAGNSIDAVDICNVTSAKATANYCRVCVYLDGFDDSVVSSNATQIAASADVLAGISMTFSFVPGETITFS